MPGPRRTTGRHWVEHSFDFSPSDRGVYIAGVDPHDANLLYVRTSGPEINRLTVSLDAGKTSRIIYRDAALQGFALADDGASVYVGAAKGGLARAARGDYRFEKAWTGGVQCLASIGGALWACTPTTSGFVLGASIDRGETFAPKLTLAGMRGPLSCTGTSAVAECGADWASFRALVGFDAARDASVASDAGAIPAPPRRGIATCGCGGPGHRVARPGRDALSVAVALCLLGARRRITRRRARGAPRSRSARARRGSPVSA